MHFNQDLIHQGWQEKETLSPELQQALRQEVKKILQGLDQGVLRVAEKAENQWTTHEWIKKAILLSFRLEENTLYPEEGEQECRWYDKVALKTLGWSKAHFQEAAFRAVPGCVIRYSAHVEPQVVLMPSFINVGAWVGRGTMVDTWATIGSCAQIGSNCHISGGVGIGGVLEPLQANPVIIEDNCFIGARSEIAEGVIVEEGAVISMGVFLGASTKIVHRETGEISYGRIPAYAVVVPGTLPGKTPHSPHLACAVIVKQVDAKTRSKTAINELLRD